MSSEQPPIYSSEATRAESSSASAPRLVIAPAGNAVQFQSGNLGAAGERATVEGELLLKGFATADWDSVVVTLKTVEKTPDETVELAATSVTVYSSATGSTLPSTSRAAALPTTLPFCIPLTPDIPQAVQTPTSSITHTLTATVRPTKSSDTPYVQAVPVSIRRYSTPTSPSLQPAPRTLSIEQPSPIQIQVPRAIFRVGEMIPVYVTIPSPAQALLDSGLQLRNIKAELVRVVNVGPVNAKAPEIARSSSFRLTQGVKLYDTPPAHLGYPPEKGGSAIIPPPLNLAAGSSSTPTTGRNVHDSTITRSGASCRFNTSRPVRLRLILHTASQSQLDSEDDNLPPDVDTAAGSITQSTVLHQISFHIHVQVAFVLPASHSSTSVEGVIPIIMVPPMVNSQEGDDLEETYMKKHDKPPTLTIRPTDDAGPAPPAFDDPNTLVPPPSASLDPPPFSADPFSAGLPSFSESQAAAISGPSLHEAREIRFQGEGAEYGFFAEDQYDGLSHGIDVNRSPTPPPAMSSSAADTNVTALAHLISPSSTSDAQGSGTSSASFMAPPPPPAMDDPMDPPPSIDARFSAQAAAPYAPTPPSTGEPQVSRTETGTGTLVGVGGPPPYLGPASSGPTFPPSYLDSRDM